MHKHLNSESFLEDLLRIKPIRVKNIIPRESSVVGPVDHLVECVSSISNPKSSGVFFSDNAFNLSPENYERSLIFLPTGMSNSVDERELFKHDLCCVFVDDPRTSYLSVLRSMGYGSERSFDSIANPPGRFFVSDSATVAESAILGHCVINDQAVIHDNVVIGDGVWIGSRSIVMPGAVLGLPGFGFRNADQSNFPHFAGLYIGSNCVVGPNTVVQSGVLEATVLEDFVKVDGSCQISHGVKLGARSTVIAGSHIAGSVSVGRNVWIGQNCVVSNIESIGDDAHISSGSVVFKSVASNQRVFGNPARPFPETKV